MKLEATEFNCHCNTNVQVMQTIINLVQEHDVLQSHVCERDNNSSTPRNNRDAFTCCSDFFIFFLPFIVSLFNVSEKLSTQISGLILVGC